MKKEGNVVYKIVDRIGFYDIVAKFIDGIEVKRFKQFAR